jgi:hypothetical protein
MRDALVDCLVVMKKYKVRVNGMQFYIPLCYTGDLSFWEGSSVVRRTESTCTHGRQGLISPAPAHRFRALVILHEDRSVCLAIDTAKDIVMSGGSNSKSDTTTGREPFGVFFLA